MGSVWVSVGIAPKQDDRRTRDRLWTSLMDVEEQFRPFVQAFDGSKACQHCTGPGPKKKAYTMS